jgi:segregation and condensation protein B
MPPTPDPPFESQPQGISLDELAQAFAQVMGVEPRRPAEEHAPSAASDAGEASETGENAGESVVARDDGDEVPTSTTAAIESAPGDEACPISPRTILEAMLFVGNRENRPLSPERAAELMRDVATDEIPAIVDDLNNRYAARGAAYRIVGESGGYRLTLCPELHSLRNRFYGRIREAKLSQAAIDVLALVAYQQPVTGEKIGRLRGKPSSHVLVQLVRRGLLRIERPDPKRRTPYYRTTDRFLQLFNLQSLDDLPHSEDAGPP